MTKEPFNIDTPSFIFSRMGVIVWANPSATTILKVSPEMPLKKVLGLCNEDIARLSTTISPLPISLSIGNDIQTLLAIPISYENTESVLAILLPNKWVPTDKRSELLAAVAHDLKNPMGAIFGYADALLDTSIGDGMSTNQRTIVERIRMTSARSVELVRNYQQLARMEYETTKSEASSVELNKVVKEIADMTWRDSDPKLQIILDTDDINVRLEKIELERIIANLLTNAQKFTPQDGAVTIKTSKCTDCAILSVSNTGSFVPESEKSLIFERYGRGKAAKDVSGTGLGLFIIKEILTRRGGSISVQSTKEEGTSFILKLPMSNT